MMPGELGVVVDQRPDSIIVIGPPDAYPARGEVPKGMKPECDCCCHKNIRNYTSPETLGRTLKCAECRCWD